MAGEGEQQQLRRNLGRAQMGAIGGRAWTMGAGENRAWVDGDDGCTRYSAAGGVGVAGDVQVRSGIEVLVGLCAAG